MRLPFTTGQFFEVFRQYNEAVWPGQIILAAMAVLCVVLVIWLRPWSGVFVSAVLAFLWAWLAIAYHFTFFARINSLAYGFAAASALGAGLFLWFGVIRRRIRFSQPSCSQMAAGCVQVTHQNVD